jgi:hypothetical protein
MELEERNKALPSVKELKILANKCKRLTGPFARVFVGWNHLETVMLAKARLGIFADTRTSKNTETHPVPDYVRKASVDPQRVGIRRKQLLGMDCEHPIGEGLFTRLRLGPRGALSYLLIEIWMKGHALHRHRGRVIICAGPTREDR